MDLLLDLHITDTLCHCGGVFSAVVKWKRLSPTQPESVLVSLRLQGGRMSHSGNGWKGADAINHRNSSFSPLNCNCIQ